MSELRDILQQEITKEIEAVRAEAESQAEKLVGAAREEAEARLSLERQKMEAEARAALRRAKSAAALTFAHARMQAKGRMVAAVRQGALAALETLAAKANYREILEALAEEAFEAVADAKTLIVHPDDRERLRNWAERKRLAVRTDPGLRLGVRIVAAGDRGSVENSLPERLERAWSSLASEVARQLWG